MVLVIYNDNSVKDTMNIDVPIGWMCEIVPHNQGTEEQECGPEWGIKLMKESNPDEYIMFIGQHSMAGYQTLLELDKEWETNDYTINYCITEDGWVSGGCTLIDQHYYIDIYITEETFEKNKKVLKRIIESTNK